MDYNIKVRIIKNILILALLTMIVGACATTINEELEQAHFALDSGDWDGAILHGSNALAEDPSNVEAALLLSAGYAGRGGFSVMPLIGVIADSTRNNDIFDSVRDSVEQTITDPNDLRASIIVLLRELTPLPDSSHPLFTDHQFQASVLASIEAFFLPSHAAQPTMDGSITPENITQDIKDIVQSDLLDVDDIYINGGLNPDNELVKHVRLTYCVLKDASSSASGFDLEVLQDLVLCQLSPNNGADLSSANGDFISPNIDSCSDFDYSACEDAGPTEQ
jgi:hypothetical protein